MREGNEDGSNDQERRHAFENKRYVFWLTNTQDHDNSPKYERTMMKEDSDIEDPNVIEYQISDCIARANGCIYACIKINHKAYE